MNQISQTKINSKQPRIAIIGCGYWGRNLVRNFNALNVVDYVYDPSAESRELAQQLAPEATILDTLDPIFQDATIAGVVIATPAATHKDLTIKALEAGKHVFVEKPLALNYAEGLEIFNTAQRYNKIVMVGHLLEYHPAINKLKQLISEDVLGDICYIYSNRLNFGKIRTEENALWSFAPHDIAIILRLAQASPTRVSCFGGNYIHGHLADVTISTLTFPNQIKAHIFVTWLNPFKEQKLVVMGSKKMAVFEDSAPTDKLKLYNQSVSIIDGLPTLKKDGYTSIEIDKQEPLLSECQHFITCIQNNIQPLTDINSGLEVLKVLETCQTSLDNKGAVQDITLHDKSIYTRVRNS